VKISELIAKLNDLSKIHGDIEVTAKPAKDGSVISTDVRYDPFFNVVMVDSGLHDEDHFENVEEDSDSFEEPYYEGGSY